MSLIRASLLKLDIKIPPFLAGPENARDLDRLNLFLVHLGKNQGRDLAVITRTHIRLPILALDEDFGATLCS
jgi:hypothetical protein